MVRSEERRKLSVTRIEQLKREVESTFRVLPGIFWEPAGDAATLESRFRSVRFAYVDAPFPSLFKERLCAYLSRFCEVPYCMARHAAFLLGSGYGAGDRHCPRLTVGELLALLRTAPPDGQRTVEHLAALRDSSVSPGSWPAAGSEPEARLFDLSVALFLHVGNPASIATELSRLLGPHRYDRLALFLSFVAELHMWARFRPGLRHDPDVISLSERLPALREWLVTSREIVAGEVADVMQSERLRCQELLSRSVAQSPAQPGSLAVDPREALSARELQTFQWIGRGYSTRQIAEQMNVSAKTIETFRARVKMKLGLRTMAELSTEATSWLMRDQLRP